MASVDGPTPTQPENAAGDRRREAELRVQAYLRANGLVDGAAVTSQAAQVVDEVAEGLDGADRDKALAVAAVARAVDRVEGWIDRLAENENVDTAGRARLRLDLSRLLAERPEVLLDGQLCVDDRMPSARAAAVVRPEHRRPMDPQPLGDTHPLVRRLLSFGLTRSLRAMWARIGRLIRGG